MKRLNKLSSKVNNIIEELNEFIIEREDELKGVFLAILARKNLLFLGDPGIAKTMIVDNIAKRIVGANYFEQTMHSQIKLEELYGPISIRTLEQEDKLVHKTERMLPEAHIVYLDEFWKANAGSINSLLKPLNEKIFFNGGTPQKLPLMCLLSSSNEIPEEEDDLAAAYDRFLLKYNTERLQDRESDFKMHMAQINGKGNDIKNTISLEEIKELQDLVDKVKIPESVIHTNYKIKKEIENALDGMFHVNERTSVHAMKVLQAQAVLDGRESVEEEDLEVLKHMYWEDISHQKEVTKCILKAVAYDKSKMDEIRTKIAKLKRDYKSYKENGSANESLKVVKNINMLKEETKGIKSLIQKGGKSTKEAEKVFSQLEAFAQEIYDEVYSQA